MENKTYKGSPFLKRKNNNKNKAKTHREIDPRASKPMFGTLWVEDEGKRNV